MRSSPVPAVAAVVTGVACLLAPAAAVGGTIAFSTKSCPASDCPTAIWRVEEDGTGPRQLTSHPTSELPADPSWSPDGTRIVYDVSGVGLGARRGLHLVNADGSGQRVLLAAGESWTALPDWSPTSESIVFASNRTDGGGRPDVPSGSPVGGRDIDVFLIESDGSKLRRLTNGPGNETNPRFSPDGTRVIFDRQDLSERRRPDATVSVALDGSDERTLTMGQASPVYSPDGRYAAFTTGGDHLWVMTADGRSGRSWTVPGVRPFPLVWASNRPRLFFIAGGSTIHRLDVTGADQPTNVLGGDRIDLQLDWTGGGKQAIPPDRTPPMTVLRDRTTVISSGRGVPRRRRPPSLTRRGLLFFAADAAGIRAVQVAIGKRGSRRARRAKCRFLGRRGFGHPRSCRRPLFRSVLSAEALTARISRLKRGTYVLAFRATDVNGNRTSSRTLRSVRLR